MIILFFLHNNLTIRTKKNIEINVQNKDIKEIYIAINEDLAS